MPQGADVHCRWSTWLNLALRKCSSANHLLVADAQMLGAESCMHHPLNMGSSHPAESQPLMPRGGEGGYLRGPFPPPVLLARSLRTLLSGHIIVHSSLLMSLVPATSPGLAVHSTRLCAELHGQGLPAVVAGSIASASYALWLLSVPLSDCHDPCLPRDTILHRFRGLLHGMAAGPS